MPVGVSFLVCNYKQVNDKVLHRKQNKFHSWHAQWLSANLTPEESAVCIDWLLGKTLHSDEGDGVPLCSSPLTECTRELYLGVERSRYTTLPRKSSPTPADPTEAMATD